MPLPLKLKNATAAPCIRGIVAAALLLTAALPASAQGTGASPSPGTPGYSRVQGTDPGAGFLAPPSALPSALIDYREEMRTFIQRIAGFARQNSSTFQIMVRDPGELIIKRDVQDESIISPARTFMRSIDAVMFDAVYRGYRRVGAEPPPEIQSQTNDRIQLAKRNGLPVFTIEYATGRPVINEVLRAARADGVVSTVVHRSTADLTEVPPYPTRPFDENPNNVLSINDVKNFVYISDPAAFGRQDSFALKLHDTNFDLIITDPFSGRDPLSKRAVETLKYKKLGAKRLVYARADIGTVASYRYYWQPGWQEGSPPWIGAPYPMDPDRYFVDFWDPGWQQIIYGNPNSLIYGLIAQGYDGVVLEGMRNFLAFEGNVEIPVEFAPLQTATEN